VREFLRPHHQRVADCGEAIREDPGRQGKIAARPTLQRVGETPVERDTSWNHPGKYRDGDSGHESAAKR
jgi:hypothetical protein